MAKMRKVYANQGTDEVNFEGKSYRVHKGVAEVPEEAVGALMHVGGFTSDELRDPVPGGLVRVSHPGGATACSWGGVSYTAADDGHFDVPAAAAADLLAHGFVGVEGEAEPEAEAPQTLGQKLKIPRN